MRAGFLRRFSSALVDLMIVISVVYLAFVLVGNPYLQKQVENYDEVDDNLNDVLDAYDLSKARVDIIYDEAKELAGDDEEARSEAYLVYKNQISVLNQHYAQDTSVYQRLLYTYNVGTIYFYTIGIGLLLAVLVISFKGLTPGRRLLKVELVGDVTIFNIIVHDLILKYVLVIVLILVSPYLAFIIIPAYFIIDIFMIMMGRDKTTLRDKISKIIINQKSKDTFSTTNTN